MMYSEHGARAGWEFSIWKSPCPLLDALGPQLNLDENVRKDTCMPGMGAHLCGYLRVENWRPSHVCDFLSVSWIQKPGLQR